MSLQDYRNLIKAKGTDLVDIIDTTVSKNASVKASSLTNDVPYVKVTDKVNNVITATNATSLTGTTGVTAKSYGPTSNVTVDGNTGSIKIPKITVNEYGQVTSVTDYTLKVTTY